MVRRIKYAVILMSTAVVAIAIIYSIWGKSRIERLHHDTQGENQHSEISSIEKKISNSTEPEFPDAVFSRDDNVFLLSEDINKHESEDAQKVSIPDFQTMLNYFKKQDRNRTIFESDSKDGSINDTSHHKSLTATSTFSRSGENFVSALKLAQQNKNHQTKQKILAPIPCNQTRFRILLPCYRQISAEYHC